MPQKAAKNEAIDSIDEEILRTLDLRGRASYMEIAAEVALSPNAVAERVRRLVHLNVISGFSAVIDPASLGMGLSAYIDVKLQRDRSADDFERVLEKLDGVLSYTLTTGQYDYTLRVACRDQADLVRIVEHLRTVAGAADTYSRIVLREKRLPVMRPRRASVSS